jgi:hypothetical protein
VLAAQIDTALALRKRLSCAFMLNLAKVPASEVQRHGRLSKVWQSLGDNAGGEY